MTELINTTYTGDRGLLIYKYIFDYFNIPFTWSNVNKAVIISIGIVVILLILRYILYVKKGW